MFRPSPLCGSGSNTLTHSGLANVDTRKRMFYPLYYIRLRRASFQLKPDPDIVWCPFPLRHTRNQHELSAITTHLVSIRLVNAYMVYNICSLLWDFGNVIKSSYSAFTGSRFCPVPGHVIFTCKRHISGKT